MIERRRVGNPGLRCDDLDGACRYDDGIDIYVWGAPLRGILGLAFFAPLATVFLTFLGYQVWVNRGVVALALGVLLLFLCVGWTLARFTIGDGFGFRVTVERRGNRKDDA